MKEYDWIDVFLGIEMCQSVGESGKTKEIEAPGNMILLYKFYGSFFCST